MSLKSRIKKLESAGQDNKEQPWLFLKSPVGLMPPKITGMMVRAEKAARGQIPMDIETKDELAWLDLVYTGQSSFGWCTGYLDYINKFMADFELNY
jgi:hypothetical protein